MKQIIKVAVNRCYGFFNLSGKALLMLMQRNAKCVITNTWDPGSKYLERVISEAKAIESTGQDGLYEILDGRYIVDISDPQERLIYFLDEDCDRSDPDLVAVIEHLGSEASGFSAKIEIMEFEYEIKVDITSLDGKESAELFFGSRVVS